MSRAAGVRSGAGSRPGHQDGNRSDKSSIMSGIEIERKFLVRDSSYKAEAAESHHLVQGYICRGKDLTVRVRIADSKAFLTVKGRSSADGTSGLDEEGNFSRFNHRFQSEISWNILNSSLVQAKQKVAACRIGLEQARVEHKSDRLSEYIDWLTARNEQTYRRAVECIYALRLKHLYLL